MLESSRVTTWAALAAVGPWAGAVEEVEEGVAAAAASPG